VTDRAQQLQTTANHQISELIDLLSTLDQGALHRPCPSREKLGDGTIGAALLHTADNYQRIARFVQTSDRMSAAHQPAAHAGHRIPRFIGMLGHGPEAHRPREHGAGQHDDGYTADNIDRDAVAKQLGVTRDRWSGSASSPTASSTGSRPRTASASATGNAPSERSSRACSNTKPTSSRRYGPARETAPSPRSPHPPPQSLTAPPARPLATITNAQPRSHKRRSTWALPCSLAGLARGHRAGRSDAR
jgi:hypothetical protein